MGVYYAPESHFPKSGTKRLKGCIEWSDFRSELRHDRPWVFLLLRDQLPRLTLMPKEDGGEAGQGHFGANTNNNNNQRKDAPPA